MSLIHINLPPVAIANLYTNHLVEDTGQVNKDVTEPLTAEETNTTKHDQPDHWKFLGNNQKNILILINTSEAIHIQDQELQFLTDILTACKLSLGDVAIFNLDKHPGSTYKELMQYFKTKQVLLMGVDPGDISMPIHFPQFQVQDYAHCKFLTAPSLTEIKNDKTLKLNLWNCLKSIFGL